MDADELLFTVSGSNATPVDRVDIADYGMHEREHLQEWAIAQPQILGPGILIITFEFDQWGITNGTAPRDRLDILGLGEDGRLVLAELKRGRAPDTVELQAIKYAAMVSRFTEEQLAELHATHVARTEDTVLTSDEALEKLQAHATGASLPDSLVNPRIVLLAEDFSPTVTASVVWLNEQGVEISLRRYQAYKTGSGEIVLSVSSMYPVPDVAAFEVRPRLRSSSQTAVETLPEVAWSHDDLVILRNLRFEVPHAVMDLCSKEPGQWVGSQEAYELAGVEQKSGMGKLAGFGYSVRSRFRRSNMPWTTEWNAGGGHQQYYKVDQETAEKWRVIQDQYTSSGSGDEAGN